MTNTTKLFVTQEPGAQERLMNTITFSSRFNSLPWTAKADLETLVNQLRAARDLAYGWKMNGPWPNAKFRIEQNGETVQ